MPGPLTGIRVVELGLWVAGPSAGGVLADWGAEVVKIEPPAGDPFRGMYLAVAGMSAPVNPPFELDNRGKRSIALDLATPEARAVALQLVERADVFVTNARPAALARAGLDWETLQARCPRLVYARVTGYGETGPDADRPSYDVGAFWSRAGIAAALADAQGRPPYQRGAMGDHTAGVALAGGVSAALLARERTGRGQLVTTSLLRIGAFVLGWDVNAALRLGMDAVPMQRDWVPNPVINGYRAQDRWFWLLGLQGQRHWPDLVRAVEKPEWLDDPRFATMAARREHARELIAALDAVFAERTLAEWIPRFDAAGLWWAPVQTALELTQDPQAAAAGTFVDVPLNEGGTARMVATPLDFSGTPWAPAGPTPECGQHTEELLLELGFDWERIGALKEKGAIP
jgi:crotonobetainyl-CoA:carnitine CoA-transferase CaiB-like acyl-CoA transferase